MTNVDMTYIANQLASVKSVTLNNRIMPKCWVQNDKCKQKVFVDGQVIFYSNYRRKLQYTPTFKVVGMVYGVQPGNIFMPLYLFTTNLFSRI